LGRSIRTIACLSILFIAAAWGAGPAAAAPAGAHLVYMPYVVTATPAEPTFEERVIALTNAERIKAGLAPLDTSAALMNAAETYTALMAAGDTIGHEVGDTKLGERITATGYSWSACGENVAAGYNTPESVVAGWMASEGHRANILNPDYTDIGVGYVYRADGAWHHFWTMDLAAGLD
jgi:uncharacterized protein YkwD